jgi:hypothetical protein
LGQFTPRPSSREGTVNHPDRLGLQVPKSALWRENVHSLEISRFPCNGSVSSLLEAAISVALNLTQSSPCLLRCSTGQPQVRTDTSRRTRDARLRLVYGEMRRALGEVETFLSLVLQLSPAIVGFLSSFFRFSINTHNRLWATLTVRVASHPVNRRKESGLRGGVG